MTFVDLVLRARALVTEGVEDTDERLRSIVDELKAEYPHVASTYRGVVEPLTYVQLLAQTSLVDHLTERAQNALSFGGGSEIAITEDLAKLKGNADPMWIVILLEDGNLSLLGFSTRADAQATALAIGGTAMLLAAAPEGTSLVREEQSPLILPPGFTR